MELCTSRHLLLTIFILQFVTVSIRQIFDFLGYMWASVLANFIYTLFIIFGVFGIVQAKSEYTTAYLVSSIYWLFWNWFVMSVYFDVLDFSKFKNILSFRTNSSSWWEINGPGCKYLVSNFTLLAEDPSFRLDSSSFVSGCVLHANYVEGIQAIIHAVFAICGLVIGIRASRGFVNKSDDAESSKKMVNGLPLYSIEYSPRKPAEIYDDEDDENTSHSQEDSDNRCTAISGNRPMTPRRVKRRNVNSKSSHPPTYQTRPEHQPPPYIRKSVLYNSNRSSNRSSARRQRATTQNPISKFLEQQQQYSFQQQVLNDSSTSNDSCRVAFTSQSQLLSASELIHNSKIGHVNPNFVSQTSLDRPPSARSSYSNYHGVRTLAFSKNATPQVPSNSITRNSRPAYSTFLSDGPPAYEVQGVVNSETVI